MENNNDGKGFLGILRDYDAVASTRRICCPDRKMSILAPSQRDSFGCSDGARGATATLHDDVLEKYDYVNNYYYLIVCTMGDGRMAIYSMINLINFIFIFSGSLIPSFSNFKNLLTFGIASGRREYEDVVYSPILAVTSPKGPWNNMAPY